MSVRRKGFTLIELLVVIAVIGILAAMIFPVFSRARATARKAVCLSNVKQIMLAYIMYSDDWDETPPRPYVGPWGTAWQGNYYPYHYDWSGVIYPYIKSYSLYVCPDNPNGSPLTSITPNWYPPPSQFFLVQSYGVHWYMTERWTGTQYVGRKMPEFRNPSRQLAIIDAKYADSTGEIGYAGWGWYFVYPWSMHWTAGPSYALLGDWYVDSYIRRQHNNGCNIGFLDGHAQWRAYASLKKDGDIWWSDGDLAIMQ